MKVAKFGGTSMADANSFQRVATLIGENPDARVIAVSAGGTSEEYKRKITDLLIDFKNGESLGISRLKAINEIERRLVELENRLKIKLNILDELLKIGRKLPNDLPSDFLLSRGEYFYAKAFSEFLSLPFVDSKEIIKFKGGVLNYGFTEFLIREKYREVGRFITGGFYGSDENGEIKTFPRGGGDITGAILAKALNAELYENYTDVDGVYPFSPQMIKRYAERTAKIVKPLQKISFDTMLRLCDFSVPVVHSSAVEILKGTGIPIVVKNTFDRFKSGTFVSENCETEDFCFAAESYEKIKTVLKNGRWDRTRAELSMAENSGKTFENSVFAYMPNGELTGEILREITRDTPLDFKTETDEGVVVATDKSRAENVKKEIFDMFILLSRRCHKRML